MEDTAPGLIEERKYKDAGFSDEELAQWRGQEAQNLQGAGFSADEIKQYFGTKDPDMSAIKELVTKNVKSQKEVKPAKDVFGAIEAGWQHSVSGLATRGEAPSVELTKDAGYGQNFASGLAGFVGDAPAMFAGFLGGGAVAGPVGAVPGAFAAPAAIRKILMDHYERGDIQDRNEFAKRAVDATVEAYKGAVVGLVTEATGGLGAFFGGSIGKVAGEIAGQTTVSKALEGELPDRNDFINGAISIGGLHAIGYGAKRVVPKVDYVAKKLMNIYAETGKKPNEVIAHADQDPTFKGELLSSDPSVPKETGVNLDQLEEEKLKPLNETKTPTQEKAPEPDAAMKEVLSRIGEKSDPEKVPLKERVKDGFNSLYAKYLDYTSVVKSVVKEIGNEPLDDNNAHVLMRLHAAVQDKIQGWVEHGTRDFNTQEINGESYKTIVDDMKKDGIDLDHVNGYRIAARSLELAEEGKTQTGSRENDRAVVDNNPHLKQYADRILAWRNKGIDYLVASGRYSEEFGNKLKEYGSYAPLKKIVEADELTGKTPATAKEIRKIGSSDKQIVNPMESDLRDMAMMIKLAHETEATNTFLDNMSKAEDPSQFFKKSENQKGPVRDTQIAGYVDGERTLYDVPKEVADSIKAMAGNKKAVSVFTSLLKPFAAMLRLGTVDNPVFAFRHAERNQLTAATLSQTGLKPLEAMLYAPEFLAKGESYRNFVNDGGAVSSIVDMGKGYLDGEIYRLNEKAPFLEKAWNNLKTATHFSHAAIVLNDNMIRFAEYKRMLEKGATRKEAAFAAREVLPDFQKTGLQQSALQQITAFLNVHLQGILRMAQETGSNPYGYIAKNLAYITVPSILLMAAQHDDDAINDLPNWQRYNYWTIHASNWRPANSMAEAMSVKNAYPSNYREMPDGTYQINDGTIFRIQKPFTNGLFFGSVVEASLDAWRKKDPAAFGEFVKTVAGSTVAEPIPTGLVPVLEHINNRSFYTGQPIVRQSMENKLPEMQYDRYTSESAKALGKMLSYVPLVKGTSMSSPKILDNYMHGWGGTLGYYAIDVLDKGLRAAGVAPKEVKPIDTLADIPFVKEFAIRFPNAHPQSVSDFEARYQKSSQVDNSIKMLEKQGDVRGAIELQDRYAINMDRLKGVDKALQNMNASVQKVYQAPDIDPVQKRQLIDTMMYQMTTIANAGNKLMDQFEKNTKNKVGSN